MDVTIPIEDLSWRGALYGSADCHLRMVRSAFEVRISARDASVHIGGPETSVKRAARVIEELQSLLRKEQTITTDIVQGLIDHTSDNGGVAQGGQGVLDVFLPTTVIKPKGEGQAHYIRAIQSRDLTFCLGPAGTGKTYLAVAVSVALLRDHKIKRIVLVRPAVEAGEKLGYLPGDLQAKVNPYLRPLFDAMNDMMTFDQLRRFMDSDVVEVVPLAFMRGRTLNHAAIILDEAQNATPGQMLMFLTRLGHGSKMIVTGDISQSDLGGTAPSGLRDAVHRLERVEGIGVVRLTTLDIVRHPLIQEVVKRYADVAT